MKIFFFKQIKIVSNAMEYVDGKSNEERKREGERGKERKMILVTVKCNLTVSFLLFN